MRRIFLYLLTTAALLMVGAAYWTGSFESADLRRERIAKEGFEAAVHGIPVSACPYADRPSWNDRGGADYWKQGYAKGIIAKSNRR